MNLSIIIPTYNEEENVGPLYQELKEVLLKLGKSFEIIFIDDGSQDQTFNKLMALRDSDKNVKLIKFKKNFGQTAAIDAGFKHAQGDTLITMDADLQNDPADIPRLLQKLSEGFDVASGWRKDRKDSFSKRIISAGANLLRKIILQDKIHDSGCTFKAYKKEAVKDLDLYGEMHRFIPALAEMRGFRVGEIAVHHRPRQKGQTKYRSSRILKGFMDMLVIKFWMQYGSRPAHLIGGVGLLTFLVGFLIALELSTEKIFFDLPLSNRPMLLLAILMIIFGAQFVMFGFLADILVKIYYKSKDRPPYTIEKIL